MARRKQNKKSTKLTLDEQEIELGDSVIVGAYSTDENREFKNDMSALKYLKKSYWTTPQDVNINLKEICNNMELTDSKPHNYLERLNLFTKFIQKNPENIIKNRKIDADFVCFRGVLTWLLGSVYNCQGFTLEAVKLKGTIYLALKTVKEQPPIHLTIFESCVLTSNPNDESSSIKKDEFNVVIKRELNGLKILFAAECDGIISEDVVDSINKLELSKLIEIKTRFDKDVHYVKTFHDHRKLDFWCQSFIPSIDIIYLGKRDDQDVVKRIEKLYVKSLEEPEHSAKFWDKDVCLKRLREWLRHIKTDMSDVDDPCTVFCYEWKERLKKGPQNDFPVWADQHQNEEFLSCDYISFINNLKYN
ncbi:decapping and exoribonuclease protein Rai1-like [Chironomus tepperi]|uniref:decapping and exoribonuclease protein Rai1-like n=1 Tax=Chironomus tepperi TaxID=113505 RepID=UPI00391FC5B0